MSEYLTPQQLVERWGNAVTVETLNNWRSRGCGPAFAKLGGRVAYPLEKVKEYELATMREKNDKKSL